MSTRSSAASPGEPALRRPPATMTSSTRWSSGWRPASPRTPSEAAGSLVDCESPRGHGEADGLAVPGFDGDPSPEIRLVGGVETGKRIAGGVKVIVDGDPGGGGPVGVRIHGQQNLFLHEET